MSFDDLPVELLDDICQRLLPTDLIQLSRTSSSTYPVAQRLLYRHISISFSSNNADVILTLTRKPQLAAYVRTFSIRLDSCSTFFHSFYCQFTKVLSSMTELTSLDLFVDPAASWVLQEASASTFPRLQHFACSFPFDSYVADFLNNTEALLELEVDGILTPCPPSLPSLPVSSLPQLSQFIGPSHVARTIVPGRPIQSIHLNSGNLTETDVVSLGKSTAHVIILGAPTNSLPEPLLKSLMRYMPHLVYLRIMSTYRFSEAPDASFYENIASALASLPDLRAFEFSGMHWGSSQKAVDGRSGRVWQSQPLISATNLDGELAL